MTNLHKFFVKNAFLWLLVLMVLMGYLIPYRESYNAYFNLGTFIDWGIVIIFLLYGLKLNLREVLNDVKNWKLHLLVQIATFVLFPLLVMPFYRVLRVVAFDILFGLLAVYRIVIGSDGVYRKRERALSDFQCFYLGAHRNLCYPYANAPFYGKQ